MNRPATAGATLSFTALPGQRVALANKNGVSHFSYNDWQQQDYYITRSGPGITTGSANHLSVPGSASRRRAGSSHAGSRTAAQSAQPGQRLLGKTRSEASSFVGRDPAWRHSKLHDARILTELTFLKISEGYDFLDPNFHRSPNTKPIGLSASRRHTSLPNGAIPVNPASQMASTGKFGGVLASNNEHNNNNSLIMSATRCRIRERKGSADTSNNTVNGRTPVTWSRNPPQDAMQLSSQAYFKTDSLMISNSKSNQLAKDKLIDKEYSGFRRENTLPIIPNLTGNRPIDIRNGNYVINNHHVVDDSRIAQVVPLKEEPRDHQIQQPDNDSEPNRTALANLTLSDFICINVEEAPPEQEAAEESRSPELKSDPDVESQSNGGMASPLASFSSISTAVEKCGSRKRSVRFSINHQIREYTPGEAINPGDMDTDTER